MAKMRINNQVNNNIVTSQI